MDLRASNPKAPSYSFHQGPQQVIERKPSSTQGRSKQVKRFQKIDLNKVQKIDLIRLNLLNQQQIHAFLAHRLRNGLFLSVYELQAIPHFDPTTISTFLPYIKVDKIIENKGFTLDPKNLIQKSTGYSLFRLESEVKNLLPIENSRDEGLVPSERKTKSLIRFKGNHCQLLYWGFNWARLSTTKNQNKEKRHPLNDVSGYLMLQPDRLVEKVIIGGYQVGQGQGLVCSSGFHLRKNKEVLPIFKNIQSGIRPMIGDAENRGIGGHLKYQHFRYILYWSRKGKKVFPRYDADHLPYVTAVPRHNTRRTQGDEKPQKFINQVYGQSLTYDFPHHRGKVGLQWVHQQFNIPIISSARSRMPCPFQGNRKTNGSVFFDYSGYQSLLFGEMAFSMMKALSHPASHQTMGQGWIMYGVYKQRKRFEVSLLVRRKTKKLKSATGFIQKHTHRYHLKYSHALNRHWDMISQFQWTTFQKDHDPISKGIALTQDFRFTWKRWRFSFRCAVFNAPLFETRLYFYERDVLYHFGFPFYQGQGIHFFTLITFKISKHFRLDWKIGHTHYKRPHTPSSSKTYRRKTALKLQLVYKF